MNNNASFDSLLLNSSFLEINKSKFYGYLIKTNDEQEVKTILESLKAQHRKASHFCFAYIINNEGIKIKASDDKEPKGTAGYPILSIMQKQNIQDVMVVVVRYFGGTKLGAGPLLRAYSKCAAMLFKK